MMDRAAVKTRFSLSDQKLKRTLQYCQINETQATFNDEEVTLIGDLRVLIEQEKLSYAAAGKRLGLCSPPSQPSSSSSASSKRNAASAPGEGAGMPDLNIQASPKIKELFQKSAHAALQAEMDEAFAAALQELPAMAVESWNKLTTSGDFANELPVAHDKARELMAASYQEEQDRKRAMPHPRPMKQVYQPLGGAGFGAGESDVDADFPPGNNSTSVDAESSTSEEQTLDDQPFSL
ncbi:hypothetical protein H1P_850019 [Hyella patelloides LEGE 07179]|uniref:Uncharacterized protein n=1 Tax=Hyella patelloides LEGE 07179 TaxID=945734 RepID=A0A563W4N6_9CYAN|nr:hypothetical protein [Hyella patelloides]VEP18662.1 hypothetical protein H1P_850019 [Hyella patelloides LEGE 07179]